MPVEELHARVAAVLTDKFEIPAGQVTPGAVLNGLDLDSLAVVELVVTLQEDLGIQLGEEEVGGDWTVQQLVELLAARTP